MSIYEKDFLAWTEQQAVLLRRREAGHLVNDLDVDWANLAEEIESMGASQRSACRSRLAVLARMLTIAPSSLAIAKQCLAWSKDFVNRHPLNRSENPEPPAD